MVSCHHNSRVCTLLLVAMLIVWLPGPVAQAQDPGLIAVHQVDTGQANGAQQQVAGSGIATLPQEAPVASGGASEDFAGANERPYYPNAYQPTPTPACAEDVTAPTSPEILEALPILREFHDFEDPPGDFLRDHPFFDENFDAAGAFEPAEIPAALDLRAIRVGPEGDSAMFQIRFAQQEAGGPPLQELLSDGRRTAQVGIYVDTDRNGISDFLITTTADGNRGLIVTRDVNEPVAELEVRLGESELALFAPFEIIGDRFDWAVFTGFTPIEGAYFRTNLDELFFLPIVDTYNPQDIPHNVGFSTAYSGSGRQCFVTSSNYNSCPAHGATPTQVPNTAYTGVLLYNVRCDGRGYDFWCLSQSFFGKHVYDAGQQGWVAKCPYTCGLNQEARWDLDSDGLVDKVFHTITDQDCTYDQNHDGVINGLDKFHDVNGDGINDVTYHDGFDHDGYLDVMAHTYLYASNQVTSCNRNYTYTTPNALVSQQCKPPQAPYTDPAMVPSIVP